MLTNPIHTSDTMNIALETANNAQTCINVHHIPYTAPLMTTNKG